MKRPGSILKGIGRYRPRTRQGFLSTLVFDAVGVVVSLLAAGFFARGHLTVEDALRLLAVGAPAAGLVVTVLLFARHYAVLPRYMDVRDMLGVLWAVALAAVAVSFVANAGEAPFDGRLGRLVPILFGFMAGAVIGMQRLTLRARSVTRLPKTKPGAGRLKRSLLVGAGDAGETVIRELQRSPRKGNIVVGFVDDDPNKLATQIHGVPVLGTIDDLPDVVEAHGIEEILILIPSAGGSVMRRVFNLARQTTARLRTLPTVFSLTSDERPLTSRIRDVQIEDVLQRQPVGIDIRAAAPYISGEHVMITGGGGSIGSELARQVARMEPASLILLGRGENSIYEIEQELIQSIGVTPISVIADVRDRRRMEWVFETYRPSVVFHAAAHKHVPLMQDNPYEAVHNNVIGTLQTAELSVQYGVRKFILLSTDKAVKPTSVMGATKRICEMIASGLAAQSETEFGVVRFGNVLGSRGSLVPVLQAQIRRGGPVRITHRKMTRYFMTIPEAVQLILQAGSMGSKGEVFILDMGEPINIHDLALDLIRMHGLVPDEDIKIEFTGIRPGEKVTEELLYDREELSPTANPKISVVENVHRPDYGWLRRDIDTLRDLCLDGKFEQARTFLMELAWGSGALPNVAAVQPWRHQKLERRVESGD